MLLTVPAFAETGVVIPQKGVNLRSGPGTSYAVVDKIPYGTEVTVTGSTGGWCSVSYQGCSGYILEELLTLSDSGTLSSAPSIFENVTDLADSNAPSIFGNSAESKAPSIFNGGPGTQSSQLPQVQTQQTTASGNVPGQGTVTGDYVNFRTGPSQSYTIKTTLKKGTRVTVAEAYGEWRKCLVNGETGFISSKYLSVMEPSQSSSAAPSTQTSGAAVSIFQNGFTGASTQKDASSVSELSQQYRVTKTAKILGYVAGSNVRFRSEPSVNSEVIGEFQYGNSIYITGFCDDWTAAEAAGKSGFISSRYVREGTYAAPAASETITAVSAAVPLTETNNSVPNSSTQTAGSSETQSDIRAITSVTGQQIADLAASLTGTPYAWGGADPETGFDCSGLVYYTYQQFGISLYRSSYDLVKNGAHVEHEDARPGDILCFYSTDGKNTVNHVGIYLGDNKFVHSATSSTGVIITELTGRYSERGYEVRRIIT